MDKEMSELYNYARFSILNNDQVADDAAEFMDDYFSSHSIEEVRAEIEEVFANDDLIKKFFEIRLEYEEEKEMA